MCKRDDLPDALREFDRNSLNYNRRLGWRRFARENDKADSAKRTNNRKDRRTNPGPIPALEKSD